MKTDDMTEAALRRVVREQTKMQRDLRSEGMELATVISIALISDVAIALQAEVGPEPTEAFLRGAHALHGQHAAMTDLEWGAYEHASLDWAELAVKHIGPHLKDPEEARHVGLIVADVMWHMGDLTGDDGWVTSLMKRVSTYR